MSATIAVKCFVVVLFVIFHLSLAYNLRFNNRLSFSSIVSKWRLKVDAIPSVSDNIRNDEKMIMIYTCKLCKSRNIQKVDLSFSSWKWILNDAYIFDAMC